MHWQRSDHTSANLPSSPALGEGGRSGDCPDVPRCKPQFTTSPFVYAAETGMPSLSASAGCSLAGRRSHVIWSQEHCWAQQDAEPEREGEVQCVRHETAAVSQPSGKNLRSRQGSPVGGEALLQRTRDSIGRSGEGPDERRICTNTTIETSSFRLLMDPLVLWRLSSIISKER
jgi:hypothetical protein